MVINSREKVGIKKYSQIIDDFYEYFEYYNPTNNKQLLIVFDDMITDMEANKTLSPIVTELFLRRGKLNNSLVFIAQSYFKSLILCF